MLLALFLISCTLAVYAAPPNIQCPDVGIPFVEPGCKVETVIENGCTFYALKCDNRKPRAAFENCPAISSPKLEPGCHEVSGKDEAGCPTFFIECVSVDPPFHPEEATHHVLKRSATEGFVCGSNICTKKQRCSSGKCFPCPLVLPQQPKPGCHLERTQEPGQCPKIIQKCPEQECPAVGIPKPDEGCTLESADENGCPIWVMRCPPSHRGKRATKDVDGFVCGSNICSKKQRCDSGKCFPCPLVLPQEPKKGCHLERTQEPGQCPKIIQKCPEQECPAVGIPKPDEGCTLESADENGCPVWVMRCPPGNRGKRSANITDGFDPANRSIFNHK